jgi:hypothetical protein
MINSHCTTDRQAGRFGVCLIRFESVLVSKREQELTKEG